MLQPPECIINDKDNEERYFINGIRNKNLGRILPEDIKYHYNLNPSDYEGGKVNEISNNPILRDDAHQNRKDKEWEPNDKTVWKTGFPTIEQVQAGELYFDTDQGEKSIIDVRGYWNNVPEWQGTAKLLTTPTLDFEQELMYLPQYSKVDFVNTDIGYNHYKPMIGTRILVYNPGDLPIDWEIKINENKRAFWSCRGGEKFRIRRFNVQRLSIPDAVDWCDLRTYDPVDNEPFKYGNKYFRRRVFDINQLITNIKNYYGNEIEWTEGSSKVWFFKPNGIDRYTVEEVIDTIKKGYIPADKNWEGKNETGHKENYPYEDWNTIKEEYDSHRIKSGDWFMQNLRTSFNLHLDKLGPTIFNNVFRYDLLGEAHPHHCYYVEPIPRQKLGHYIKLFYWQTIQWRGNKTPTGKWVGIDLWKDMMPDDFWVNSSTKTKIKNLSHPLVNFIRMFNEVKEDGTLRNPIYTYREKLLDIDYEDGIAFAARYDELYELCINEKEQFELYWDTLKKLLSNFKPMIEGLESNLKPTGRNNTEYSLVDFIYDYINCPSEYIFSDTRDLDYGQEIFNAFKYPEWITEDYIEIDQKELSGVDLISQYLAAIEEDPDAIFNGKQIYYNRELLGTQHSTLRKNLDKLIGDGGCLNDLLDDYYYLNTENRMLYSTENPYGMEFVYKPNKNIMNDAITKGKWFKLPPGWSLLDVEPVMDESLWGGKRWRDGRPFDWGIGGDFNRNKREVHQLYDYVNDLAREQFLKVYRNLNEIQGNIISYENVHLRSTTSTYAPIENPEAATSYIKQYKDNIYGTEDNLDEWFKFKVWYENHIKQYPAEENYFAFSLYSKKKQNAEYTFLKIINELWQLISPYYNWTQLKGIYFDPDSGLEPQNDDFDVMGKPLRCIKGDISDWWWYACHFSWANFPPLYWAMADLLNNLTIKYIPLFY